MLKQLILLILLGVAVWGLNLFVHPDFFSSPDAAIYANVARNIIEGKGAVSDSTLPLFFTYYPASSGPWPSPYPLFYPLILALGFKILGSLQLSVVLVDGFFFVAAIPVIYLLARKIFDTKVAVISSIWYLFNPTLLSFSISGMTEPLFIFLTISAVYLFFLNKKSSVVLSGIMIGLASLTRFQGLLFLPIILGLIVWQGKKRLNESLIFFFSFLLPILLAKLFFPPTGPDYATFANHHFWLTLAIDAVTPKAEVNGLLTPITLSLVSSHWVLVFQKFMTNAYYFFQGMLTATVPSLIILLILSFFIPLSKTASHLKNFLLLSLLIFIPFHWLTIFDFRYMQTFIPLVIILAAATFLAILERSVSKRVLLPATIFTLIFIILPAFTTPGWGTSIQRSLAKPRQPTILQILGQTAQENTPGKDLIATDQPAHITWYGRRRTIIIPSKPEGLLDIEKVVPIDTLFLSNYYPEHYPAWQDLVENPRDFGDFQFVKSFEIKPEDNYYRIPVKAVLYLKRRNPTPTSP